MQIIPFLLTQQDIMTQCRQRMRDTANRRWTSTEVYNAINDALRMWSTRVQVPYLYTLPGGLSYGVYTYALPWWITPPIDVEAERVFFINGTPVQLAAGIATYQDVPSYHLEPDGNGGQTLRLEAFPYATNARVIWWGFNGPVPQVVPTLNAGIGASDASLTIATSPDIRQAGYVKIDDEWMQYAGYAKSGSTTTLQNLERGINGTTAASHSGAASVYWGIAVHRDDLYGQLVEQVMAQLHNLFLQDASPKEIEHHTFQVRYHQQLADEYWHKYTPNRAMKMRLTRQGVGLL